MPSKSSTPRLGDGRGWCSHVDSKAVIWQVWLYKVFNRSSWPSPVNYDVHWDPNHILKRFQDGLAESLVSLESTICYTVSDSIAVKRQHAATACIRKFQVHVCILCLCRILFNSGRWAPLSGRSDSNEDIWSFIQKKYWLCSQCSEGDHRNRHKIWPVHASIIWPKQPRSDQTRQDRRACYTIEHRGGDNYRWMSMDLIGDNWRIQVSRDLCLNQFWYTPCNANRVHTFQSKWSPG
jgi:hypothetical protein